MVEYALLPNFKNIASLEEENFLITALPESPCTQPLILLSCSVPTLSKTIYC